MRKFTQFIVNKFKQFHKDQTNQYKINQVMNVVNAFGSFVKYLGKEFYIRPEQSRCSLRYTVDTKMITGIIELDVRNEYQFKFVEKNFDKYLKHKLNTNTVKVDFYLKKLYD